MFIGGHFKPHRDTEKVNGIYPNCLSPTLFLQKKNPFDFYLKFGTLALILPSTFEGGQLAVRHNAEEKIFDFASGACHDPHFIAFYGDCEHGILPLERRVKEESEGGEGEGRGRV